MNPLEEIRAGFAGKLAETFLHSRLTPVIAIASLVLGLFAVYLTPKEEEPQISVPMIDIQVPSPGFSPEETERKVTEPVERAVWGLEGVEYIYSTSKWHGSYITVRFKVGEPIEPSLVKIHHKLMEAKTVLPKNTLPPIVKSYSIDDVPFLALSFSSESLNDYELRQKVGPLARELSSTPDLASVQMLGGLKKTVRVKVDPSLLSQFGVTAIEVAESLKQNDALIPAGKNWSSESVVDMEVGGVLRNISDVKRLPVAQRGGRVVRIQDLAQVEEGPEERTRSSVLYDKSLGETKRNAVTIVFAKRKGTNVVNLSKDLIERAELFQKDLPKEISLSIIRDYGSTAEDKSHELIEHLLIATISVTILIALWMGWRSALVVAIAIPVTLALTLAIYYFLGYTLNRVTLFALIFSIGILVDDAIVVVENIERHLEENPKLGIIRATLIAVSEVGNPTILATFTVIAAILPMAFVRGLMGPYMKPIPVGASLAMILSLIVAFVITPWASVRLLKESHTHSEKEVGHKVSKLDQLYIKFTNWLLGTKKNASLFGAITIGLLLVSMAFVAFKWVKVKMLPFDNKEEFQVLIDYEPKTTLTQSMSQSEGLAKTLLQNPNVEKIQIFGGEAAPFSFSGMVKHSFLRNLDSMNDLQIILKNKNDRKDSSHEIIESLRGEIKAFGEKNNAVTKVLEIPPGPPVMATMVAEVYGPNVAERKKVTEEIYNIFKEEPSVVDLDTSLRNGRPKMVYPIDFDKSGLYGIKTSALAYTGSLLFSESPLVSLATAKEPEEVSINLSMKQNVRSSKTPFQNQNIMSMESGVVSSERVLGNPYLEEDRALFRKNLKPVNYVMSELSGEEEAPVYGMLKLAPKIHYETQTADVPWNTTKPVIKWDGEWFITYEVFRDLGGAFAVVILLIYVLVLGWFKSYTVPLIIMAPIPISLIGILPGHWVMGAYFTATSMIGFIAGAGIIVRNSIILVDFIEGEIKKGVELKEAVVHAGVVRFRPMLLTASAVVVGSFVMLFDPIFQGLAISLMFGEIAATVLSRFAVPVLYYWFIGKSRQGVIKHG
ncbi:efflux RND transporter permease subunit [Leptospira levettii]|uniref:efflux RND transporter permease subunit n=1 Tax=Leptospira levettii TaxID=2023178 RepID=UPI0010836FC6|nr:efflux RND transporter permease subunit [Leptospira levettii]MCW7473474.1 efflux RND transporter permease subunit [Leptospira levettii]TGK98452.1 efflux RND transporter permease subunit [Leptospira levettii]TGM28988.1 efflux RND transporter permease subunit [Leptospira levettii]TGM76823.1 efflux RND transporter permease subunit [Leptospira levettii]TGM83725.1 efflux RND transporter permease subunit [Leptospira levettii]